MTDVVRNKVVAEDEDTIFFLLESKHGNQIAYVDRTDWDYIKKYRWWAKFGNSVSGASLIYVSASFDKKTVRLQRLLLNPDVSMVVDHINHNGLDNRRSNLRVVTQQQNLRNTRKQANTTSQYKGVHWNKTKKKWIAKIRIDSQRKYIGTFTSELDAALAYQKAAKDLFGEHSYTNLP